MAKRYKVAIVGDRDAILPFKMIGFDAYPVASGKEADTTLRDLAKQEKYAIIYLTENFAATIPDTIRYFDTVMVPAVILIPTHQKQLGIGRQRIQDNVEKAIGADIL